MEHVEAMLQGLVDRLPHSEKKKFNEAADVATSIAVEIATALQEQCRGIGVRLVLRMY